MKAFITVGISGSGKTTWAEQFCRDYSHQGWINSNRDDLRFNLFCRGVRDWSAYKFSKAKEKEVTVHQHELWEMAAACGRPLIVSDTHLNKSTRESVVSKLDFLGYEVEIKDFPITLEEAWRRDSVRPNGVGRKALYRQWKQWLEYSGRKVYVPDTNLPKAVIFDIDGTLAHMGNRRGPFEWDKVHLDIVDEHVTRILDAYQKDNYRIIVMSGRDSVCCRATMEWLHKNDIRYTRLFMRSKGDMRKDSVIKEELFWTYVAPYYNIEVVFDDRPQVVRIYRDMGLRVIAVADQNLEF